MPEKVGRLYICAFLTVTAAFYKCVLVPKMSVIDGGSSGSANNIYSPLPPVEPPRRVPLGKGVGIWEEATICSAAVIQMSLSSHE